jgi:hypothetical protein
MKKIKLNNYHKKIFADTITPVEGLFKNKRYLSK